MNKIIIFGYKSFLQKNLFEFLKKKKFNVIKKKFTDLKSTKCKPGDYIINCSINNQFFYKDYKKINDRNLAICSYLKNKKVNFIMLSTRQVYKPGLKITERSKVKPINIYAKNYLLSENNCNKVMGSDITILRVSNVVGFDSGKKKRLSMLNKMLQGIKSKQINLDNSYNCMKDILPVHFFCIYLLKIIKNKAKGIINIGSGQSLTLLELAKILIIKKKDVSIKIDKNILSTDRSYKYNIKKLSNLSGIKFTKKDIINEILKIKKMMVY